MGSGGWIVLFGIVEDGGTADQEQKRKPYAIHPKGKGACKPGGAKSGPCRRHMGVKDKNKGGKDRDQTDGDKVCAPHGKGAEIGAYDG